MTTHNPVDRLVAGFRGFHALYYEQRPERIRDLVDRGQKPKVLMIACSDSRVDPAIITNSEPGEIFIVRNVANMVPPYAPDDRYHGTSAAIEYAVRDLKVEHIVILGHSRCGGIQALMASAQDENALAGREFVGPWVSICRNAGGHDHSDEAEKEAIKVSLENLCTFPWIAELVNQGKLDLHGWWFQIETGNLWELNRDSGEYQKRV